MVAALVLIFQDENIFSMYKNVLLMASSACSMDLCSLTEPWLPVESLHLTLLGVTDV